MDPYKMYLLKGCGKITLLIVVILMGIVSFAHAIFKYDVLKFASGFFK